MTMKHAERRKKVGELEKSCNILARSHNEDLDGGGILNP